MRGIDFFKDIIEYESILKKNMEDSDFTFNHSIQTNGYLLNSEWISFISHNRFDVGVSIDGPEQLNSHYGQEGVGRSTKKVLSNIKCLRNAGIMYAVICVITKEHAKHAKDIYNFCIENEIHDLSLNFCFDQETANTVENTLLLDFLKELFLLYFKGDYNLNIREFNEPIARILGYATDSCATQCRKFCGQYLTFRANGEIYFCDSLEDESMYLANIKEMQLHDVIDSTAYLEKLLTCRRVFELNCLDCLSRDCCGGGCYRWDDKLEGVPYRNHFCNTLYGISQFIQEELKSN